MAYDPLPPLGQADSDNSLPVVIASDQSAVPVDGSGVTQPVSAASLPLPTGAASEATLAAVLTESEFDTLTGSVTETAPETDTASSGLNGRLQRIAQRLTSLITAVGSPFQAGGSIGNTSFGSTIADGADVTLGAKADAKSTATDTTPITIMSVLKQISASIQAAASSLAGTLTVSGTVAATQSGSWSLAANQSVNVAQINGVAPTMGNGVSGTGVQRVTVASDSTGALIAKGQTAADSAIANPPVTVGGRASTATPTAMSADGDVVNAWFTRTGAQVVAGQHVDDAAFTVATDRVQAIGLLADETSTDSVDEGDIGLPRMTLDRKQIVVPEAHTAGGATPYKLISAASTNATSVKASAGQIYSIVVMNLNASQRYLKLYNKASSPTVGTDTPVQVYMIPGAAAGAGFTLSIPVGMQFDTGIAFALTTGIADSDTGAVAANEIVVNLTYK